MYKLLLICTAALLVLACAEKRQIIPEEFDPKGEFEQATGMIEKGRFEDARLLLSDIKKRDTEMEYAPLAQLKLADSYVEDEEPELAVEEYRRFLRDFPRHKHSAYAQYQVAVVYYGLITGADRGNIAVKKALEAFEALNAQYPRNPYRELAGMRIRECRKLLGDYEFLVGEFYYKKEAYKGAAKRFIKVLNEYPDYPDQPKVLYHLASSFRHLGEVQEARRALEELLEKFPKSPDARKALEEFGQADTSGRGAGKP